MAFFSKPKITREEFKRLRSSLRAKGLSRQDVEEVEQVFHGDLHEHHSSDKGIDRKEIKRGVKWLRENKSTHGLSDSQIDTVEKELNKKV